MKVVVAAVMLVFVSAGCGEATCEQFAPIELLPPASTIERTQLSCSAAMASLCVAPRVSVLGECDRGIEIGPPPRPDTREFVAVRFAVDETGRLLSAEAALIGLVENQDPAVVPAAVGWVRAQSIERGQIAGELQIDFGAGRTIAGSFAEADNP
jgi:hypothetical protein